MRIGTRRSALALAQAEIVARLLGHGCEIIPMVTRGDQASGTDEDKSRWVAELEDDRVVRLVEKAARVEIEATAVVPR